MRHKVLTISLLIIFAVLLALGLILPRLINEERLKAMVISKVKEKAKLELSIEKLHIQIWPWPRVNLNGVTAKPLAGIPPEGQPPAFNFSTRGLNAYINIPSLLRREINLEKITLQDVNLVIAEKGCAVNGDMAIFMRLKAEDPKDKEKIYLKGILDLRESEISREKKVLKEKGGMFILSSVIRREKERISLEKINLRLKEGELNLNGEILGPYDKEPAEPVFNFKTELKGIAIEDLLALSTARDIIQGKIYGELLLEGRGKDSSTITQSLNGPVHLEIKDGKITTLNLLRDILSVAGLLTGDSIPSGDYTAISILQADFKVAGGRAVTDNLWLLSQGLEVKGKGFLTLDQKLDFKLDAYIGGKSYLSEKLLGRFLSDSQGRLIVPILITGDASKPKVRLDMERIATGALGHQLEKLLEKIQNR